MQFSVFFHGIKTSALENRTDSVNRFTEPFQFLARPAIRFFAIESKLFTAADVFSRVLRRNY